MDLELVEDASPRAPSALRIGRAIVASADHRNRRRGEAYSGRLPTQADFAAMRDAYAGVAPDPAHFDEIAKKVPAMVGAWPGWSDEEIRQIDVPVLVMIGDTDFILVPDAAETAELLPQGQLAVLPDHSHMDMIGSDLVTQVAKRFLRQ